MSTITTKVGMQLDRNVFTPYEMANICHFHNVMTDHDEEYRFIPHEHGLLLFLTPDLINYSKYYRVVCLRNNYDLIDHKCHFGDYMELFDRNLLFDLNEN